MTIYAIFAALVLFGSLVPFLPVPPVLRGRAFNNAVAVWMEDRADFYPGFWVCKLAQELGESAVRRFGALLIGAPFAWLLSSFTPFGIVSPIAAVLACLWDKPVKIERQINLIGWAVEIELGQRLGIERYAPGKEAQLSFGYRRQWPERTGTGPDGALTVFDMRADIARWRPVARFLLFILGPKIGRFA